MKHECLLNLWSQKTFHTLGLGWVEFDAGGGLTVEVLAKAFEKAIISFNTKRGERQGNGGG